MTGIVGSVWTLRDNLTDISWASRTPLKEAALTMDDTLLSLSWEKRVRDALAADLASTLPTAPDVYSFGKEIARMARLALIADELGERFCGLVCCWRGLVWVAVNVIVVAVCPLLMFLLPQVSPRGPPARPCQASQRPSK